MTEPEFDHYSRSYQELLCDPIRNRFAAADSEFFHIRKRDLIRSYFRQRATNTRELSYLDVGCGLGELMLLLRGDFTRAAGCDISRGMIGHASGLEVRLQKDPCKIPFEDAEFDVVSAVCGCHHVPEADRIALTREIVRVLKPGGTFVVIEHNPYNPVTRLIVNRSPIDRSAQLLRPRETRVLMSDAGLVPVVTSYFLLFPHRAYNHSGATVEHWLSMLPFGGQYAVFGKKQADR